MPVAMKMRAPCGRHLARPVRHPAMLPAGVCRPAPGSVGLRIEVPECLAGGRVDRSDLAESGARIKHASDHDRRRLEVAGPLARGGAAPARCQGCPRSMRSAATSRCRHRSARAANIWCCRRRRRSTATRLVACRQPKLPRSAAARAVLESFSARNGSPLRQHLADRRLQLCVRTIRARAHRRHGVEALSGVLEQRIETGRQARLPVVGIAAQRRAVPAGQMTDVAVLIRIASAARGALAPRPPAHPQRRRSEERRIATWARALIQSEAGATVTVCPTKLPSLLCT